MILCCLYGYVVSLLLQELATSEVAAAHVSHEFLTLGSQTSPKGFSKSFWGHLWPIIKQVKEILIFRNRIALPVYVLLWIFSAVIVETFFPGVIYKRCFDWGSMWLYACQVVHTVPSRQRLLPSLCSLLPSSAQCLAVPFISASWLPPSHPVSQSSNSGALCWICSCSRRERLCSSSCGSSCSSKLHEDTNCLSACFREVQLI